MIHFIKKYYLKIFLGLLAFTIQEFILMSQETIFYNDESQPVLISSDLYIFEDSSATYHIDNILNESSIQFKKTNQPVPSFSFTKTAIWLKFKLEKKSQRDCYLEISPPILNDITFYQVYPDRHVDSVTCGSFYTNQDNNALNSVNYIFKIDSNAVDYFIRVKSKTRLFILAHLGSYQAMVKKTQWVDMIQNIYAGIILMIFIYHIFLFITSREKIYLFYLCHLVNTGIYFLYISGFGIKYFWYHFPVLNSYFLAIMSFGFILSILFVINFLDSRKNIPVLHHLLIGAIFLLLINGIIDFAGFSNISGKLLNYFGQIIISLVLISAIMLIRRGFKPAYIFLSAWILYLTGIAIQTLQALNYIPTNWLTSNSIQIGSSLEVILLAISVGNKINFYKSGKLQADDSHKKHFMEKEALKSNQKLILEERLQEKTEMLYEKIKELKRQNKEIEDKFREISLQNQKISEYHEILESKNKLITRQNEELKTHKENLEGIIQERTWELQEATRLAEEADEQKTAFLRDFSHELRTPMNAISGFSTLLMETDPEDKLFDYYTGIIVNSADSLLELVDNIIELSRLQSNELVLKKVRFDPIKLFLAIKEKSQEKLKKDKKSFIELILDLPNDKSTRLNLDYNRFWKIVQHLVDNSIKYTETGSIRFGYFVKENKTDIEVFVVDTGIGIKKEKLEVVFESFRKVEKSKIRLYPGTGIGLSLVKGLVRVMNGMLEINTISQEDAIEGKVTGTSIKITIPDAL